MSKLGDPAAGDELFGKYRVERVLGEGGMGIVFGAKHIQLDEPVAIKIMTTAETTSVERFIREAKAMARIRSEHVVRVYDVGADGARAYIVMEYLEGCDLGGLVEREGALALDVAVEYVLQACVAVAEAHAAGIVHRDLKPANLFLTKRRDGSACIKVLDFGISKLDDTKLTRTSALMGSPSYMAPEHMEAFSKADRRSDIWALGVVLFELVTGRLPFEAESLPELCVKVREGEPLDMKALRPELPIAFTKIVSRCLEKNPAARFQSMGDLAKALAPFGSEESQPTARRAQRISGSHDRTEPELPAATRSRRWPLVALAVVVITLVLAFALNRSPSKVEPTPSAPTQTSIASIASTPTRTEPPAIETSTTVWFAPTSSSPPATRSSTRPAVAKPSVSLPDDRQ